MKIETNRNWLLIEAGRVTFTLIFPGSSAAIFADPCDKVLGWSTSGDGVMQTRETRFFLGRVFATLGHKPKRTPWGLMPVPAGAAEAGSAAP